MFNLIPTDGGGQKIRHDEFECLRVKLLFKQSSFAQATGLVNAGIFIYISSDITPPIQLVWWAALILVLFVARLAGHKWFSVNIAQKDRPFEPYFWENIFA